MEADRIEFKRGSFVYVTPNTNFVSVKGEKATIQLAFNTPAAGPNGIGGITVDGTTSGVQMKTAQKGHVMYAMNVLGWEAGECRRPLVEPGDAHKEQIEQALQAAGLIKE